MATPISGSVKAAFRAVRPADWVRPFSNSVFNAEGSWIECIKSVAKIELN